jgi:hypothetical protein
MSHPYNRLPRDGEAFWQPAVGGRNPLEIEGLRPANWSLSYDDKIATAGSCFAQHIGKALQTIGYQWMDSEPAPQGLADAVARKYGYGVFSFRTGNIYTAALLRQWTEWALGVRPQSGEAWESKGRVYDPFRPAIEPDGFASAEEMFAARDATLAAIRRTFETATLFVFTFGLTEGWVNGETKVVYPMCPGTLAGSFDDDLHRFCNYRYNSIYDDMLAVMTATRAINPNLRFLLTVSPVPLTATASGQHVLTATTYSKSVLRAVAGDLAADLDYVDYFPSYEIITAPVFRGMFYKPNNREVSPKGVDFVMSHFFGSSKQNATTQTSSARRDKPARDAHEEQDVQCEEALLEAFGSK